jgi:hypothetical protein
VAKLSAHRRRRRRRQSEVGSREIEFPIFSRSVCAGIGSCSDVRALCVTDTAILPAWQFTRVWRRPPAMVQSVRPGEGRKDETEGKHVGSVEPEQSVMGIMQALGGGSELEGEVQADTAQSAGDLNPNSAGSSKR